MAYSKIRVAHDGAIATITVGIFDSNMRIRASKSFRIRPPMI